MPDLEPSLAGTTLLDAIRANELVNQASQKRTEKRYKEAIALAEQATRACPTHVLSWNMLGAALEDDGQLTRAAEAFMRGIEVGGNHYDASYCNFNLGRMACEAGRSDEAVLYLSRAIAIRPNYTFAHRWLGWEYEKSGRLHAALDKYEEAVLHDPHYEDGIQAAQKLRKRLGMTS